jgi:hypothetical protein
MKTQLRKLRLLSKIFDLDDFYNISLYQNKITLQGKFSAILSIRLNKLNFIQTINENGFINFKRNNIEITLTD